jgi:hypothetical protein
VRIALLVLLPVGFIVACVGGAIWEASATHRLSVTVINRTGRPLRGVVVSGYNGFSLPLGDLGAGATATRKGDFGATQGRAYLHFTDGEETPEVFIGHLLDDDGPYRFELTVRADEVVVHVEKPTDAPGTWVEKR